MPAHLLQGILRNSNFFIFVIESYDSVDGMDEDYSAPKFSSREKRPIGN